MFNHIQEKGTLDVGKSLEGEFKTFIAFPNCCYDISKKRITGYRKHMVVLNREDTEWVIKALQKELSNA